MQPFVPIAIALGVAAFGCSEFSLAQTTPRRPITGTGSFGPGGVTVTPSPPKTITKKVTYLALTGKRQWLSASGRSILARLVAFDQGDESKFVPPTVVRDDKVRLLKDGKVFLYEIDKLAPDHQDEILEIQDKLKAVYAAKRAAAEKASP